MSLVVLGAVLWDVFDDRKLIGGAPFNVAAHATRLGIQTAFISAVGNDALGREALKRAEELGLATRYIRTVEGVPTGTVRVFLQNGQPDFEIVRPAAYDCPELTEGQIVEISDSGPEWLYFGTLEQMAPTVRRLLHRLLDALPVARRFYDVNLRKESFSAEIIEELLGLTSVLKLNEDEAGVIAGMLKMSDGPGEGFCKEISAGFGLECVCITRGENGCAIWREGDYVESAGCPAELADAVGAGDAFSAALIHGLSMQWDLERVAAFANRLGALVASRAGAVPDWSIDEITV